MVEDYKSLKRVENTQDATLSNLLLENFIMFFDWGFTDLGGFYSVEIPEVGLYGGNKHELRPVQDPNYNDGQGNRRAECRTAHPDIWRLYWRYIL